MNVSAKNGGGKQIPRAKTERLKTPNFVGQPGYYPSEESADKTGTIIKLGDRIANTDDIHDSGIVYGVYGKDIVYLPDVGESAGDWRFTYGQFCTVLTHNGCAPAPVTISQPTLSKDDHQQREIEYWRRERAAAASERRFRLQRFHSPKACVDEFIKDARDLLSRVVAFHKATTPLRHEFNALGFELHINGLRDLIAEVVCDSALYITEDNPRASPDWQAQAFNLLRWRESRHTYQPPNVPCYITTASVDSRGDDIKPFARVECLTEARTGTVIYVADDCLLYVADGDASLAPIGDIFYGNCRQMRVISPDRLGNSNDVIEIVRKLQERQGEVNAERLERAVRNASAEKTPPPRPMTLIVTDETKDANGRTIANGDRVNGTGDAVSCGHPTGGTVVAVAGNAMLIEATDDLGETAYFPVDTDRYIVQREGQQ